MPMVVGKRAHIVVTARALIALRLVACAPAPPPPVFPIDPPSLSPGALVLYGDPDPGRHFLAPPGGKFDGLFVQYPSTATLEIESTWRGGAELADARVRDYLSFDLGAVQAEPRALREQRDGLTIVCLAGVRASDSAGRTHVAVCARIEDAAYTRGEGVAVIVVFQADSRTYAAWGGARVAAEVVRSARGFAPPPD